MTEKEIPTIHLEGAAGSDEINAPEGAAGSDEINAPEGAFVRIPYLSYLRAIGCLAIVILHVVLSAIILYEDRISSTQIMISRMVVYASMWSVPCFIMVTGALQLNPDIEVSLKDIVTVFIWRVFKALLLCCVLFQLFDIFMDGSGFTLTNILGAFSDLFQGESWAHLWYLYMLIGLYLLLPFFRIITKHGENALIRYGLAVTIFFISILPLTKLVGIESAFIIPLTTIYPVYLFLGYAIHRGIVNIKRIPAVIMIGAGLILTVALTFCKYTYFEDMPDYLLGSYASIVVVLCAAGVFALLKDVGLDNLLGKILFEVDRCSFGIYLVHMVFIRLVLRYWNFNPYEYGAWIFGVLIIGTFAASYVVTFILKKIPVIRNII